MHRKITKERVLALAKCYFKLMIGNTFLVLISQILSFNNNFGRILHMSHSCCRFTYVVTLGHYENEFKLN